MVVKFFGNKKGGSSKSIDYLLNEREALGTAKVLQGDPQLTKDIINSIQHKQKVTVGCLSFEEKNIPQEQKYKLMKDFEEHLLPNMKDRYNILWVEHTDKGRLELNFVIPKIELETQKSLNPYYHKADLPRVEKWQDLQNLQYGYSNPKDPSKKRTLEVNGKQIGVSKNYEQLDKLLHNLTRDGKINNRKQLIELCESNNISVTRKGKDYISLKLPESKKAKKFKGSIYNEQFTSIEGLRELGNRTREEIEKYNTRNVQRELERLKGELAKYTLTKEREYSKKFEVTPRAFEKENEREFSRDNLSTSREYSRHGRKDFGEVGREQQAKTMASRNSNHDNHISIDSECNYADNQHIIHRKGKDNNLFLENKAQGLNNDSTRATTNGRTEPRERDKLTAYNEARQSRMEFYRNIKGNEREIQSRAKQFREEQQRVIEKSDNHIQSVEPIESKVGELTRFKERASSYIKDTRKSLRDKYNSCIKEFKEITNKLDTVKEFLLSTNKKIIEDGKEISYAIVKQTESHIKINQMHNNLKKTKEEKKEIKAEEIKEQENENSIPISFHR